MFDRFTPIVHSSFSSALSLSLLPYDSCDDNELFASILQIQINIA